MVGGLLVSQVLTLFTTPVIYLFFDRLGRRWRARAAPRQWPPARRPEGPHEPVFAVHPAAGRDHAAEPVDGARRRGGVHAAAGLAAAAGGLPGHHRVGQPARREPRDDGVERGDAARARARDHRRRQRDHLEQLAGLDAHLRAVRSRQGHQRRRARGAGGHQRLALAAAERACRACRATARSTRRRRRS